MRTPQSLADPNATVTEDTGPDFAVTVLAELAQESLDSEFILAVPTWAKDQLSNFLTRLANGEIDPNIPLALNYRKQLTAAIRCVHAVEVRCNRELLKFGSGKTGSGIRRHKRTRAEIRASKASGSSSGKDQKKQNGNKKNKQ